MSPMHLDGSILALGNMDLSYHDALRCADETTGNHNGVSDL